MYISGVTIKDYLYPAAVGTGGITELCNNNLYNSTF